MSETLEAPQTELVPHGLYDIDLDEFRRQIKQPSNAISTRGKRFKFPDGASSPGPMDCIVLDFVEYNTLHDGPYDPDNLKAPTCWAYNKYTDSLAPDPLEVEGISESCTTCPKNDWVKDPKNPKKNVKECKNQYRLAVVQPKATAESDIFVLTVSPTGRKYWAKYLTSLRTAGRHHRQQITTIDWDPNAQQTLTFTSTKPHELEPTTIQKLLTRCTEERLLYTSPAR